MFNLKKLNEVECKKKYRVVIWHRFAALEYLDTEVKINSAWETTREYIKISAKESLGYCELKKHKLWFDEGWSKLIEQGKQAKFQWLQDPSDINVSNLNSVRREASRHLRTKTGNIWKTKLISFQRTILTRTSETCIEE
jgi:hypothetical protein